MKSSLCVLVALGIAVIAAAPLTYPGPLQTHSGFTPIYALLGDPAAAREVGTLPLALASILNRAGAAPDDAFKLLDGLSFVLGALGMFWLARPWAGDEGALVASVVYTMLPYRLMTAYVRGAHGETLFLGLLPLVAVVVQRVYAARIRRRQGAPKPVGGEPQPQARIARWFMACGLAILAALVLWRLCVPFAPDSSQASVYLFQIFSARWDYGSHGNWLDAVPLQLGVAPVGLGVVALFSRPDRRTLMLALGAALLAVLSIEPVSGWWPWAWLLNVPWQLLGLAGLCLALLSGRLAGRIDGVEPLPALAVMVSVGVLASYPYLAPSGLDYTPAHLPLAQYDSQAYLVDARVPALRAGTTVTVTLWWQAITPPADSYKVFVHAIDSTQKIWAQRDAVPADNTRPTNSWLRGEFVTDPYALDIPADAPGSLQIEVGLYRADTGDRLKTTRGDDRVVIGP